MFYTFNSAMTNAASSGRPPASQPRGREGAAAQRRARFRSFRACKRCRLYRIKCGDKPCCACQLNNAECVWSDEPEGAKEAAGSPNCSAPEWTSMPLNLDDVALMTNPTPYALSGDEVEVNGHVEANLLTTTSHSTSAASSSAPSSAGRDDSATFAPSPISSCIGSGPSPSSDWVQKFQLFFQKLGPTSVSESACPNPFPILPQDASAPRNASDGLVLGTKLNRDKQAYFVRLFWVSWGPLFPLMAEEEFESLFTGDWPSMFEHWTIGGAIIDGMTALGLQCGHAAGVGGRMLGLWPDSVHQTSLLYFNRCRDRLRSETSHATIDSIRCYILLTLYELQANRLESAYYMVGLGVRRAHMSSLHKAPPTHIQAQEVVGRIRAWWLLHWLDIHCSMQLDWPSAVLQTSITCPLPPDQFEVSTSGNTAFGWSPWRDFNPCAYFSYLTKFSMIIVKALDAMPSLQSLDETDTESTLHASAERIWYAVRRLETLFAQLPEQLVNPRERADVSCTNSTSDSPEQSALLATRSRYVPGNAPVTLMLGIPDWLQRQRIMLELYYLNARVVLQRSFVFLQRDSATASSSENLALTKQCAEDAIQHACSIISMLKSIYLKSDILDGLTMVCQFLWTATTTIAAQIFVDPEAPQTASLSESISNTLAILESLSCTNPEALHIYEISRSLVSQLSYITGMSIDFNCPNLTLDLGLSISLPIHSEVSSENTNTTASKMQDNEADRLFSSNLAFEFNLFETSTFLQSS